jgi:hypothetical protein
VPADCARPWCASQEPVCQPHEFPGRRGDRWAACWGGVLLTCLGACNAGMTTWACVNGMR